MNHEIDPKLIITRDEAQAIVPDLVTYMCSNKVGNMDLWEKINAVEVKTKVGTEIIVGIKDYAKATVMFVHAKVSSSKRDWRNEDGPVIRVKAGNLSWRVDGSGDHFLPIPTTNPRRATPAK